ncbi:MAG: NAD-dependent epimerase/dehydratase family protein [Gammaproteobacteria bacterium]|nr:NAD-dependent epimerase/dehydratase family protein [Gammaproteobacteria bacterium]
MAEPGILVTGASGFVGRVVCDRLERDGYRVRRVLRPGHSRRESLDIGIEDIGPATDWSRALSGVDAVVHLAARVHIMRDTAADPLAAFRHTNVAGTEVLARAAARAGVRRFIFVSSVKVNGERTEGRPFTEHDAPGPEDAYGISKWEAEQRLAEVAADTGMAVTVLRPPLMYGPGVKGNFLALVRAVSSGWPLPRASIRNARSLLYVGNLADAVALCLRGSRPGRQTYLLSDGEDVSTPDLVRRLAVALDRPARLLPVPAGLLRLGLRLTGRGSAYDRLAGSLQVDSSAITRELGWRPPHTLDAGLRETVAWYRTTTA